MEDLIAAHVVPEATEGRDELSGSLRATEASALTPHLERELTKIDQKNKRKIRRLEYQLQSWKADGYGSTKESDGLRITPNTLAVLTGRVIRFHMMTKEVRPTLPLSVPSASPFCCTNAETAADPPRTSNGRQCGRC